MLHSPQTAKGCLLLDRVALLVRLRLKEAFRITRAATDEVLRRIKPGMTELEIAPTRRLRGLGDRQRKALLEKFDFS